MLNTEEVNINFYRVTRCGYYAFGENDPAFSSINDVLRQLEEWTSGSDLSLTKIADPGGNNQDYPIYLLGIHQSGGDWVFATWNEVPSHETGVASVKLDSKVGTPEVHINGIEPNSIPGYATYFWVIPSMNLMATIRFTHLTNGQRQMQNYLGRFMSSYTKYAISGVNAEGQPAIIGYTDLDDRTPKKVRPYFKTMAYTKVGPREFILDNQTNIRKVVRRGHVTTQNVVDRAFWQKAIRYVRGSEQAANSAFVKQAVYVEIEYQPSHEELRLMIDTEIGDIDATGWDDLGFVMQGEASKTYWVGRAGARGDFQLNVDRLDEEAVDLASLLTALNQNRPNILQLLE